MTAQIKIIKRAIDRIGIDGSECFYWNRELLGSGLRVRASSRKFFVAQFRRMTLGPDTTISPEKAHRRAMALLSEAKGGTDPAAQRDADRKDATTFFKDMLNRYRPKQRVSEKDAFHLAVLLKRHSEYEEKVGIGIEHFEVKIVDYGTQCFRIVRTDGTGDDFSYPHCINCSHAG